MVATIRAPFPTGTTGTTAAATATITTSVTLLAGDDLELHVTFDKSSDTGVTLSPKLDPTGANLSPDGSSTIVHSNGQTVGFEQVFWWLNASLSAAGLLGAGAKNLTTTASTTADTLIQKAYALTGATHSAPTVTTNTGSGASASVVSASCPTGGLAIGHFVAGSPYTATNQTNRLIAAGSSGNAGWCAAGNSAAGAGATISLTGTISGSDWWAGIATVWTQASSATNAPAGAATGTGTANNATVSTGATTNAPAGNAAGTGTAYFDPSGGSISLNLISDSPIDAVGTAYNASISTAAHTNASAGNAAATGTANGATGKVSPTPAAAAATGTANNATVQTGSTASAAAGLASGTGAANNAIGGVAPGSGVATATGAAQQPSPAIRTGAGVASGFGTANNATGSVASSPGATTGTGTANAPAPLVAPGAGPATASGAANNAAVQTGSFVNANPTAAAGSGMANNPAAQIAPGATAATAAGTALNATVQTGSNTTASAGVATASGTAYNATVARFVFASAGSASATGTANGGHGFVSPTAQTANGLATASNALIAGAVKNAQSSPAVTDRRRSTAGVSARTTSKTVITD